MKLEVGKTYVRFDGKVLDCKRFSAATDDDAFFLQYGRFVVGSMYYHEDGTFADGRAEDLNVSHEYKEETTVEYKTFGEMTDEEKGALLLAQYEGKTIELLSALGIHWISRRDQYDRFYEVNRYRVKAEPVITTGSRSILICDEWFEVSYTQVDGVLDHSTLRIVKRVTT
jgi:hypothetical protein